MKKVNFFYISLIIFLFAAYQSTLAMRNDVFCYGKLAANESLERRAFPGQVSHETQGQVVSVVSQEREEEGEFLFNPSATRDLLRMHDKIKTMELDEWFENVEALLKKGANINASDEFDETFISKVIDTEVEVLPEVVEFFLEKGLNIDEGFGESEDFLEGVLFCMQQTSKPIFGEIAKVLIEHGVSLNKGFIYIFRMLYLNKQNEKLWVPLFKLCVECNVDINMQDGPNGGTPLHYVCANGSEELFDLCLAKGADIYARNKKGKTMLHKSVIGCNIANIKKLILELGVNVRDCRGRTPLHVVCKRYKEDFYKVVMFLLDRGADISVIDSEGETPLTLLCKMLDSIDFRFENSREMKQIGRSYSCGFIAFCLYSLAADLIDVPNEKKVTPFSLMFKGAPFPVWRCLLETNIELASLFKRKLLPVLAESYPAEILTTYLEKAIEFYELPDEDKINFVAEILQRQFNFVIKISIVRLGFLSSLRKAVEQSDFTERSLFYKFRDFFYISNEVVKDLMLRAFNLKRQSKWMLDAVNVRKLARFMLCRLNRSLLKQFDNMIEERERESFEERIRSEGSNTVITDASERVLSAPKSLLFSL